MPSYNHIAIMGNLTSDVDLRRLPSGIAVASLRVAVTERFKSKSGDNVEKPVYIDVDVWDRQAENCAQYLSKGSPVFIDGKLQMDEWTGKDGEKRSKLKVRAATVQFLSGGRREESPSAPSVSPSAQSTDEPLDEPEDEVPF